MEITLLQNKADSFQVWKCLIELSCCEDVADLHSILSEVKNVLLFFNLLA